MTPRSIRRFVLVVGLLLVSGCLQSAEQRASDANSRGVTHLDDGKFDEAIADFTEAIRLDPRLVEAYCNRSVAHAEKGEFDRAVADCNQAVRIVPEYARAFATRGRARFLTGDHSRAIADYALAIRLAPDAAGGHDALAWFLATCPEAAYRNGKQAVASATKACELTQWEDFNFIDTLAAAYAEDGNFQQAVEWQEKVLSMAPENQKEDCRSRLDLYKSGKPYHETPKE